MQTKLTMENFEKFLKNDYKNFNNNGRFKSEAHYLNYLGKGLKNINRSEFHLRNGKIADFYQWMASIDDLPAKDKKTKKYYEDQKVAIGAFMKFYKYSNGIIKKEKKN